MRIFILTAPSPKNASFPACRGIYALSFLSSSYSVRRSFDFAQDDTPLGCLFNPSPTATHQLSTLNSQLSILHSLCIYRTLLRIHTPHFRTGRTNSWAAKLENPPATKAFSQELSYFSYRIFDSIPSIPTLLHFFKFVFIVLRTKCIIHNA